MPLIERSIIKQYILAKLGYPTVSVELAPEQISQAITEAVDEYQSVSATERAYLTLQASPSVNEYKLPPEVGTVCGVVYCMPYQLMAGGAQDLFTFASYTNPMGPNVSNYMHGAGNLAVFYEYIQNRQRLVGNEITYNVIDNTLYVYPYPKTSETIIVQYSKNTYDPTSGDGIISASNTWGINWIKKFALASAKGMLAQARGKYSTIGGGPGESQSLNGAALQSQSNDEIEKLKTELAEHHTSAQFFIG